VLESGLDAFQQLRARRPIEETIVRNHSRDAARIADVGERVRIE
jgi:hypothetical protein